MQHQLPEIRSLCPPDWHALWPVLKQAAAEGCSFTYPTDLDEETGRRLWLSEPTTVTIVALDKGEVAGSSKMGPNQMGPGAHVATASCLVAPSHRGKGIGRALALWSIDWARRQGYTAMQFNAVVESNTAAVALWRSLDFQLIGRIPGAFELPSGEQTGLLVMHRFL